jgi:hypothetical protein
MEQAVEAKAEPEMPSSEEGDTSRSYAMSREGRRQANILLLGAASLWVFGLWTLINALDGGLSGAEWVTTLLMLGIVVVAPVVAWALLEEANSRYIVEEGGLRYRSLGGVDLTYAWDEIAPEEGGRKSRIARFFLGDDDAPAEPAPPSTSVAIAGDEEEVSLEEEARHYRVPDHTGQIANPVARILHKLAYGSRLPVHNGVENRGALLNEIGERIGNTARR